MKEPSNDERDDGTDERSVNRRTILQYVSTVGIFPASGCLGIGDDKNEIHQVVRDWESDKTFVVDVDEGDVINVELDTRREVPGLTTIHVLDPDERPVGTYELFETSPVMFYEVDVDGSHTVVVEPTSPSGNQSPVRVWVRITVHDTLPSDLVDTMARGVVAGIDQSATERVHEWELRDEQLSVTVVSPRSSGDAVTTVGQAYASGVDSGLTVPIDVTVVTPDGETTEEFVIEVALAREYAAGEITTSEYVDRILETTG